jgi:UDP-N-acetylmuramoyl-tripeptide--D-alanyl-D-alanine ligase
MPPMTDAPTFSAAELLRATGGVPLRGGADWSCHGISTDTRTLESGNLFVALAGERFDGHDCLDDAVRKEAAGLIVRSDRFGEKTIQGPPAIGVPDTLEALGAIARAWRERFSVPLVAITGSSGKTTTKEMLTAIASLSRKVLATTGNLNNQIGLPHTIFGLRPEHELAIVEMGTNSPGEIAKLAAIARPNIGLITNIGQAHLEGLGSLEAVREEKGSLFSSMNGQGTAIFNHDDEMIGVLAQRWQGNGIRFGLRDGADVTATRIESASLEGSRFNLIIGGIGIPVRLSVPGRHNVLNALAAAAAATALGFDRHEIAEGLARFHPVPGRMEIRALGNGAFLIIDTYNANPLSVQEALKTLQGLRGTGRGVVILGDMLELGERAAELHARVGAQIVKTGVETVFLKGDLSRSTAAGATAAGLAGEKIVFFDDPQSVVRSLRARLDKGDWILVKGSRRMKMEKVAEAIIQAFDLSPQRV